MVARKSTGDIAPTKSYEETTAVQDEKVVLDEKPDLSDSGNVDATGTGRRKSVALNIIENPLLVSLISPLTIPFQSIDELD